MSSLQRNGIPFGSQKNERFKRQPKQTNSASNDYSCRSTYLLMNLVAQDVIRSKKHNQSSLQIAAN